MESVEGLILKQISYKESSKIIYVYTKTGLQSFMARGAKKIKSPFLSATENLMHVLLYATGKGLKTLTEVEVIHDYRQLKENLEKFTYVQHIMEITHFFSENEYDHEKLFGFLIKVLEKVETNTKYIRFINMFELKFLYLLGVNPELHQCVSCGKLTDLVFTIKDGGLVCEDHRQGVPILNASVLHVIKTLYYHDIKNNLENKLDYETMIAIRRWLDDYYQYHLNFKSKSRQILMGLLGY
jgi:DNA repair protein RecO (recombination protein O)